MSESDKVLRGQEAIDLYKQGKNAWNKWAEAHDGWTVDFNGMTFEPNEDKSFEGFIFPGRVIFSSANFGGGNISFRGAKINGGNISFRRTVFGDGDILFDKADISGCTILFNRANFCNGNLSFCNSNFSNSRLLFSGSNFLSGDIDFEKAIFNDSKLLFSNANFGKCNITLDKSEFNNSVIDFKKIKSTKGRFNFSKMIINRSNIAFGNSIFLNNNTSFLKTQVLSGNVSFFKAQFGNGTLTFRGLFIDQGSINFSKACFKNCDINFRETSISTGSLDFSKSNLGDGDINFRKFNLESGNTNFNLSKFGKGTCNFENARLIGNVNLTEVTLESSEINFNGLEVGQSLKLDNSYFPIVPDFRNLSVGRDVSMINMRVKYQRNFPLVGKASKREHCDMYRKLKSIAMQANDHQRELEFFTMEERSKWGWQKNCLQYLPTLLYNFFSDFGRSILRPAIGLGSTWLIFSAVFLCALTNTWAWNHSQMKNSLLLSASHLFPFFPWSRGNRDKLIKAISDKCINEDTVIASVEAIAYLEGFLALIFVFLIGLALRNRFRI